MSFLVFMEDLVKIERNLNLYDYFKFRIDKDINELIRFESQEKLDLSN